MQEKICPLYLDIALDTKKISFACMHRVKHRIKFISFVFLDLVFINHTAKKNTKVSSPMFPLWMVPEVFRLEDLIKLEIPVQTFISPALFITVGVHIASNYQLTTHQGWTSVLSTYRLYICNYSSLHYSWGTYCQQLPVNDPSRGY